MASKKKTGKVKRKVVKTLYLDRATWHRGIVPCVKRSALLTEIGTQCCLGFFAKRVGYKDEDILEVDTPASIEAGIPRSLFPRSVTHQGADSDWTEQAIRINDNIRPKWTELGREKELVEHFAKIGIKLVIRGWTSKKVALLQKQSRKCVGIST